MPGPFSLYQIVAMMLRLYYFTLLARVFLSWFPISPDNPIVRFIYDMTEPVMRPFRGLLPPVGGLDFSPILVFLAFSVVSEWILRLLFRLGI